MAKILLDWFEGNHSEHILRLVKNLNVLEERKNELLNELNGAMTMQAIWPNAFDDGQKCSLKCLTKRQGGLRDFTAGDKHKISFAYLEREDGEKHLLTRKQLIRLGKIEGQIHKQYEVTEEKAAMKNG
jgi:hypothetical protein